MLNVVTCLWDANEHSRDFSRGYDEVWVARLAAGFRRHLPMKHRFVVFVDRERDFGTGIEQEMLSTDRPGYGNFLEPFRLNEPMILVGLDTIVTGYVGHMAEYCLTAKMMIALPRNPKKPSVACNGVALVPAGKRAWWDEWQALPAETKASMRDPDMEWMAGRPHMLIDDLWPGQVVSAKVQVKRGGLGDARLVYFHGFPKPSQMLDVPWVREHWLGETRKVAA